MFKPNIAFSERIFILTFGLFHFLLPFVAPPNFLATVIPVYGLFWGLNFVDLVVPGAVAVALLSIAFIYTKHLIPMVILMFMYSCGAFFHALFLLGFLPPLLVVGQGSFLFFGLIIDIFTVVISYDYYRRCRSV